MVIGGPRPRVSDPPKYRPLDADSVLTYLRSQDLGEHHLGGGRWHSRECGDGNLNLVFIVQGSVGSLVVKQALPYVRMVGESWPLSLRRNFFEQASLCEQARWAADFVPAVHHADDGMALIVMEFLTPHEVLRTQVIGAKEYPRVGQHLGLFLARTLFNTSELRLSGDAKKNLMAGFLANTAMCQISEDLIFDEPYFAAPLNRHTSPQLDAVASALTRDTDLKVAVQAMKWRFMNQPECLLHGDLHTGSVMVTQEDTRVIDPEFAFYGPMGFDIGVLLANFLLAYLSQPGHAERAGARNSYGGYLLDQAAAIWTTFVGELSRLWQSRRCPNGASLCNPRLNGDSSEFSFKALASRLQQIWDDALGFAGCEMIRRIIGLAHVADFETIIDQDLRAKCEQRVLRLARTLLIERSQYRCMADLTALARAFE